MRRLVWGTIAAASAASAIGAASCVGDDPSPSTTISMQDGSTPAPDGSPTPIEDSGTGVETGSPDAGVNCNLPAPQTFPPVFGTGPFCSGAGAGNHCAFGEHCCRDTALNTQTCAADCEPNEVDLECLNAAECNDGGGAPDAGRVCCAKGSVKLGICSWAVTDGLESTACAATCTNNEFQVCASNVECLPGKPTCTPTRALTPDGKAASTLQIAACR